MRYTSFIFLIGLFTLSAAAQDLSTIDTIIYEGTFEDFTTTGWWTGGITNNGVIVGIEGNDTAVMDISVEGGTANTWDQQMGVNWNTPENAVSQTWRIQYLVRVENAPFNIPTWLQINQDPWSGVSTTVTIPAGFEKKWLFFDLLLGASALFTTTDMGLRFQLGAQKENIVDFDDIRVYLSKAWYFSSFETTTDIRVVTVAGGSFESASIDGAPNGIKIAKIKIDNPGSALKDALVSVGRFVRNKSYTGAYRMYLKARSSVAPLTVNAGFTNINDWSGAFQYAKDPVTIVKSNTWTDISFLLPNISSDWTAFYPFLQLGGQGNVVLDLDSLFLYRTDEAPPVSVSDWSIY